MKNRKTAACRTLGLQFPHGKKRDFDAAAVRDMFQGNAGMQMTLLKLLDRHNGEMKARVGVDRAPTTLSTYLFTYRTLSEFIKAKFKVPDLVFGQLNEQFIRDYQDFILLEKGYAVDTLRGYLAILKRSAASPTRRATRRNTISATSSCPSRRRQHRKHSAVRISRSCVIWRYRKTQVTCHHPGPLPLRLLHRHRLCRCGKHHPEEPLPG